MAAPLHDLGSLFAIHTLYTESYVVVFPPGHRLRDLTGEPYLDRLSCELRDMVTSVCYENDVTLYARCRSEREDWIQGMVMAVVLADKAQAPSPAVRTLQHEMAAWRWT